MCVKWEDGWLLNLDDFRFNPIVHTDISAGTNWDDPSSPIDGWHFIASPDNGSLTMTLVKGTLRQAQGPVAEPGRSNAVQDKAIVSSNQDDELEKFVFNEDHAKLYIPQDGEMKNTKLIDKLENITVDLDAERTYTFIGSPADRRDRFVLAFRNDILVEGEGELQIFDVMGRLVSTQHVTNVETIEKPSQPGIYIFKFNGKTQKIVVK